jgi:RHS repeat-associated protein
MSLRTTRLFEKRSRLLTWSAAIILIGLIAVGVFAGNGWLPFVDGLTGAKTGWFGKPLPRNSGNVWNPINSMLPTTAQLSKSYIYAGSKLVAVEESGGGFASANKPTETTETKVDDHNRAKSSIGNALTNLFSGEKEKRATLTGSTDAQKFDTGLRDELSRSEPAPPPDLDPAEKDLRKRKIGQRGPSAETGSAPAPMLMQQLPESEQGSLYSYENNLGAPPGQVEADSPSEPATLDIRHRAGIANFSFDVALASLPGRNLDAGAGIVYNSRTWNKSVNSSGQNHFAYDVEASWIAPGFTAGFGYMNSATRSRTIRYTSGSYATITEVLPLDITEADGTRRKLDCRTTEPITGTYSTRCTSWGTSDGSFVKVYKNKAQYTQVPGFNALYPDGSKVNFGNGPLTNAVRYFPDVIRDRNGNKISIWYKNNTGRIDYILDTLYRQIKFYYENDAYGNPDKLVAVTVPGMTPGQELQTVRFYYEDMSLNHSGKFVGQVTAPSVIRLLRYVYTPATKTAFKYDYHPNYGMMKKITRLVGTSVSSTALTATGSVTAEGLSAATTEYDYPDGSTALSDVPKYTKRTDDWFGRTAASPQETFYDAPEPAAGADRVSEITVRDADLDVVTKTVSHNTSDWQSGLVKETSTIKRYGTIDPANNERPNAQTLTTTKYFWSLGSGTGGNNPRLTKTEVTNDSGLTKASEFEYDQYNNQTRSKEYDFAAPGTLGALLRTTETTYETGAGWINANLLSLPKSTKSIVGGTTVSKTLLEYDHNGSDAPLTRRDDIFTGSHDVFYNPAHPAYTEQICPDDPLQNQSLSTQSANSNTNSKKKPENQNSNSGGSEGGVVAMAPPGGSCVYVYHYGYTGASKYRGNVTKVTRFADATLTTDPGADVTNYNYDIAGSPVSATLSCCNLKTISYSKDEEYAYPRSETKGTSPQLTTSVTYNRNTGLVLTSTNENGQVTSYEYETDTLRPRKTVAPNGGHTLTEYSDKLVTNTGDLLPAFVRTTATLDPNNTSQSYTYFNGRGSNFQSASLTPDGWSVSATKYDLLGRARVTYNPFYAPTPNGGVPAGTKFTEVAQIDALGRILEVRLQDLTVVTTEFSNSTDTPAVLGRTFSTVTDQAGKKRRQLSDALGRTVRVDEPDTNGILGTVEAPTQPTYYEYDGNDNLVKVIQSDGAVTQERKFKYDSLSRLTHEKQVEADPTLDALGVKGAPDPARWTKVLKYNADGLLSEGVDARGVKTTFAYDGLNRVQTVAFSDGTPTLTYTYDQSRAGFYNNGAVTRVETADGGVARPNTPATATEFDYDQMGRVARHRQSISTQTYELEYGYNLAGQIVTEKYPSGKIVTNTFDQNGRLAGVADQNRTYITSLQYHQYGGALSSANLGNGTTERYTLNDRLQMIAQSLERGSEVLQKYDYGYGQIDANGILDPSKNNGQLAKVDSFIGAGKQWTKKLSYDPTGRLSEEKELRGDNDQQVYLSRYDFDRFGNMYRKAANNGNSVAYTPIEEPDVNKATNRFATNTIYDEAGNVVQDAKFRNKSFSYDANGRMFKTSNIDNTNQANSVYDASGMRVAENVNGAWRYLIYDIGGKLVEEYGGPSGAGGVRYPFSDWQGSTRATTDNTGAILSRSDYSAYGEELTAGTGQRTSQQGFGGTTNVRQKYGLTERDDATGLDHTWFRKHENKAGRWTSPDPYNGSASVDDPQGWNRYSYVKNQPTNYVDPSGLNAAAPGGYAWSCWGTWRSDADGSNFRITSMSCQTWSLGGGTSGAGGGATDKDKVRNQLEFYLQNKSIACEKALKALRVTDKQLLNGFDKNTFLPGGPSADAAETKTNRPWTQKAGKPKVYGPMTSTTQTKNGVVDFLGKTTGFLIHELTHAVTGLGDTAVHQRLLNAQKSGAISGVPAVSKTMSASQAISQYLNKACGTKDGVDSPMPNGNNSGSTSG